MNDSEKREIMLKEIDLIQNCITRMAQNSFMIKGWVITLVAACCALSSLQGDEWTALCIVGFLAIILFWYLDAFFLRMERLYRYKYEWIIKNRPANESFYFDLNPMNKGMWEDNRKDQSVIRVMFSRTLWPMYLLLLIVDLVVVFIQY